MVLHQSGDFEVMSLSSAEDQEPHRAASWTTDEEFNGNAEETLEASFCSSVEVIRGPAEAYPVGHGAPTDNNVRPVPHQQALLHALLFGDRGPVQAPRHLLPPCGPGRRHRDRHAPLSNVPQYQRMASAGTHRAIRVPQRREAKGHSKRVTVASTPAPRAH
jgi:hypothetical protein